MADVCPFAKRPDATGCDCDCALPRPKGFLAALAWWLAPSWCTTGPGGCGDGSLPCKHYDRWCRGNAGMYGRKSTFEDAKVTVTEFLDDFYDDSGDNFNQAFLNLERRLQEYFGYEARGPADGEEDRGTPDANPVDKRTYAVYMDGAVWVSGIDKDKAEAIVRGYSGEHEVWFKEEGVA